MPLVLLTGLPSSGKTHRAQQILADFQSRLAAEVTAPSTSIPSNLTVQLLQSSHASLDPPNPSARALTPSNPPSNPRDVIFNSAREEKTARAEEFSAAKRALSKTNIVISDAPNYIKGYRYQMWCEAKAVGTRSVVVHVAAREDECTTWNEERLKAWGWNEWLTGEAEAEDVSKGPKIGKDVRGELQPESHTAIFGDRLVDDFAKGGLRSRSSSMGGGSEDEVDDQKENVADTMTLKSLYLSGKKPDTATNDHHSEPPTVVPPQDANPERITTASPQRPAPTASLPYTPSTLRFLCMRYEPPSPFTRWDTPLFTVPSTDEHPPYQAIWDALFPSPSKPTKKAISQLRAGETAETKPEEVRRHAATVLPKATGAEALQTLESATADVVKILLATARERSAADGDGGTMEFHVPDPKSGSDIQVVVTIPPNTMLSQPALQRLRRKYTQIQRGGIAHGQGYVSGRAEVVRDFHRFLETEWNTE